jgi:formate dehydrogenase (NADP+) beta subunit
MVTSLLFLGGLGAVAALLLGIASRVFYVEEDPRIGAVSDALPGANCGGCGYAGCAACAEAIVVGKCEASACVAGGFETAVAVGEVMGVKVEAKEPELAATTCTYGTEDADLIYRYSGAENCKSAMDLFGGSKTCSVGCLGLGSCVMACNFDALEIGDDHLPVFNPKNCVGCGACAEACPKNIIGLTNNTIRMMTEYSADECTAPCQRSCPTGIDIPEYIKQIKAGNFEQALRVIKEKCPLPLVCGRICPAPCETECRRTLAADDPVAINPLKRFVADYERTTGKRVELFKNPDSGKRTAVIGAGAEGLTAANYLARLGHAPTLFEAKPKLGGILRYVISQGRLSDDILDDEIKGITDQGIEVKTEHVLGKDFSIASLLRSGFDAILLTTGGFDSRKILRNNGNGPMVPGMHLMVDYLAAAARGKTEVGEHVLIVGAAHRSLATAESCLKNGAAQVTIISSQGEAYLPEDLRDTDELAKKNIQVLTHTTLTALFGEGDRLVGAKCERRSGDEMEIAKTDLDTVIVADGRLPELVIAPVVISDEDEDQAQAMENKIAGFAIRPTWFTPECFRTFAPENGNGMFSSPEPGRVSDASAVVKAILSGRRVVRGIHLHLTGKEIEKLENLAADADRILNVDTVEDVPVVARQEPSESIPEPSTSGDWTAEGDLPGLSESESRKEAERCLRCGLICYKKAM